jgi:ADP-ribose pyrophosphatase
MNNPNPDSPPNVDAEVLFEGRYLTVKKEGRWEFVARNNPGGIVVILAITDEQKLILVEQFRAPVNARVIELPAGLVGDIVGKEHESLHAAAKRELLEETGYEAEQMEYLMDGPPSAGLSSEVVTFFRARGLQKISEGGGDKTENIVVHAVPVADLRPWLSDKVKAGFMIDYKIYAALYLTSAL